MSYQPLLLSTIAATWATGLLAGITLGEWSSLHALGSLHPCVPEGRTRAAGTHWGVWLNGVLIACALAASIVIAVEAWRLDYNWHAGWPYYLAVPCTLLHGGAYVLATAMRVRQGAAARDTKVSRMFARRERWLALRALLQQATLVMLLWALATF